MDPSPVKLLLLLSLSLLCRATGDAECTACSHGSHSPEKIRQLRLEQLRKNILAQIGLTELPRPPPVEAGPPPEPDLEILEDFQEMVSYATESKEKCISGDFYAKPVKSFIGVLSEGLQGPRFKRAAHWDDPSPDDPAEDLVLNEYTITMNFDLQRNLSDIYTATLVMHQEKANTLDYEVPEKYQSVEIQTIIDNVRYFVGKKDVDVYESGLQSFDITRAAHLWLQEPVLGSVKMEVTVLCSSCGNSQSSNMDSIAKVSFVNDSRIITVSRSPLESRDPVQLRTKRQAPPSHIPDEYCSDNESTCCLQPLDINFKDDLGIDFITRPKTFRANFCNGYCPEVTGTELSTSQRFQILRHLDSSPTRAIRPCCAGIEYRNLEVIVSLFNFATEEYETSIDLLEQVAVTKCRCG